MRCSSQWMSLALKFALSSERHSKSITIKCSGGDFYGGLFKGVCCMSFPASCPGSLQIWYHLQTDRSPDVFSPALGNLADGRLHRIRIHRVGKNLYVQVSSTNPQMSRRNVVFCFALLCRIHTEKQSCIMVACSRPPRVGTTVRPQLWLVQVKVGLIAARR